MIFINLQENQVVHPDCNHARDLPYKRLKNYLYTNIAVRTDWVCQQDRLSILRELFGHPQGALQGRPDRAAERQYNWKESVNSTYDLESPSSSIFPFLVGR
jgi:hypothetical protein